MRLRIPAGDEHGIRKDGEPEAAGMMIPVQTVGIYTY